jgi:hypothetical protein
MSHSKRPSTALSTGADAAAAGLRRGRGDYARTLDAAESAVAGQGLFARVAFARGDFVCDYFGSRLSRRRHQSAGRRSPDASSGTTRSTDTPVEPQYTFDLNQYFSINPFGLPNGDARAPPLSCSAVARFINHSCDPNLAAVRIHLSHDLALGSAAVESLRLPSGDGHDEQHAHDRETQSSSARPTKQLATLPPELERLRAAADAAFDEGNRLRAWTLFTQALHALVGNEAAPLDPPHNLREQCAALYSARAEVSLCPTVSVSRHTPPCKISYTIIYSVHSYREMCLCRHPSL